MTREERKAAFIDRYVAAFTAAVDAHYSIKIGGFPVTMTGCFSGEPALIATIKRAQEAWARLESLEKKRQSNPISNIADTIESAM